MLLLPPWRCWLSCCCPSTTLGRGQALLTLTPSCSLDAPTDTASLCTAWGELGASGERQGVLGDIGPTVQQSSLLLRSANNAFQHNSPAPSRIWCRSKESSWIRGLNDPPQHELGDPNTITVACSWGLAGQQAVSRQKYSSDFF